MNRRLFLCIVLLSFSLLFFVTMIVLRCGLGATPYETADSSGRRMGFNDHLSLEHYIIMARNFRPWQFLEQENVYAWVLLAMHLLGAGLLISERRRWLRSTPLVFRSSIRSVSFGLGRSPFPARAFGPDIHWANGPRRIC